MTQEELKEMENKANELKALISDKVKEETKESKEQVVSLQKELTELKEALKAAQEEAKEHTELIAKLGAEKKTTEKTNKLEVILKENADKLKAIKGVGGKVIIKDVGDITRANVDSLAPFYSTDTDINMYPARKPFLRNIINVGTATGAVHQWYEQGAGEGDAGMTDENTPKNQRDQDWALKTAAVQKITAYTKVTEEALEDIPFMEDAIRTDLMQKLMLYEDAQILAGSGTDTPTQLKGILEFATAFNVTNSVNAEFYHKIQDANDLDVLRIAIALVAKAHGSPNYICLNPADVALMDVTKTTNGAYILPPFTTADGTKFKGCTIIENTGITAGTFLVMDSMKVNYKVRKDYDLAVGYDDDDFTNNRITIRAELRGVLYVKGNDTGCIIKGTFANCKAMITSGAATQNVAIVSPLNEDLDAVQMEEKTTE